MPPCHGVSTRGGPENSVLLVGFYLNLYLVRLTLLSRRVRLKDKSGPVL